MSQKDDYLEEEFRKLNKALAKVYKGSQNAIKGELGKYLSNYQGLDKTLQNEVKTGNMSISDAQTTLRQEVFTGKKWKKESTKLATILYEADKEAVEYANSRTDDIYVESRNFKSYEVENKYHVDVGMSLLTATALDVIVPKKTISYAKEIVWNMNTINMTVLKYTKRLDTFNEIARRTARYVTNKNSTFTNRSLQNLLWGVSDQGEWEAMLEAKSKGIDIQKQWVAYLDDRTRDTHRTLDGQIEDVDKYFVVYGKRGRYNILFPRQPDAAPEMICNCRCRIRSIYPKYENINDMRRAGVNPREVIPFMTYREWEDYKSGTKY